METKKELFSIQLSEAKDLLLHINDSIRETRNRIYQMFPTQNKIELFAREKHEGWDVWGNEVESSVAL